MIVQEPEVVSLLQLWTAHSTFAGAARKGKACVGIPAALQRGDGVAMLRNHGDVVAMASGGLWAGDERAGEAGIVSRASFEVQNWTCFCSWRWFESQLLHRRISFKTPS